MNTKNIFKTVALAMMMPAMLLTTACSNNDDEIVNTENPASTKGYALPVTINVTRQGDDATTRATYTYDEDTKKGTLSFSTGDKLFVSGSYNDGNYSFAGMLDYVSDGKFSGTIMTQTEWTGTYEELLSADGGANATLLPAGYGEYGYLSIADEGTYEAYLSENPNKAFATSKATAVEQFSWEDDNDYSSGFELTPVNAILNFTINGLDASTEVDVSFSYPNYPEDIVISGKVTTDGDGTATFAIGIIYGNNLKDCNLTVDGNAIALPDKEVEAGHIYNISRSVAPAGPTAYTLAESTVGMIVGSDGKAYAVADKDNLPSGVTAVAMVAYKGSATGEASPYNHGLAIAMKDAAAGGTVKWSSSENDESLDNYTDYSPAVTTAQSGLSNSQTSGFDNESNYPAFYAALHNTITVSDGISAAAPASGTSGWFLPSLYQWNKIVQGLSGKTADLSHGGNANANYTASSLNPKIEAAGGTGLQSGAYWPSTEAKNTSAWYFYTGNGSVGFRNKTGESYVRAVFAF